MSDASTTPLDTKTTTTPTGTTPLDRRTALRILGATTLAAGVTTPVVAQAAPFRPDREWRVPVRGGSIYVRGNGGGSGGGNVAGSPAPILFIHGGPGGSHWSFLPALALADAREVLLYDQLDSGRSQVVDNPANWTVDRFVSEIDAIRAGLDLDRLHICGVSWGAAVAAEYAARQPSGLLSVVLGGALISTRSWEASARIRLSQLPAAIAETIRRHERDGSTTSAEYTAAIDVYYAHFLSRNPIDPAIAAYRDALPLAFNARLYTTMWGAGETASSGTLRHYDAEPLLPRIKAPTLFLTGEYDEMVPAEVARLAALVPGAETRIVPGAGHRACLDNPAAWVGDVRRWAARFD